MNSALRDLTLWIQCGCTALVALGAAYASYIHGRQFALLATGTQQFTEGAQRVRLGRLDQPFAHAGEILRVADPARQVVDDSGHELGKLPPTIE
ncbi:hypothetical protein [Amycolatopsis sp. lyj-108]|uniref:hypothetical protein n=1 Tax=Amycolatopsis sp. lyj-108 TaxID=2789286 RepID=UPI00397BDB23